MYLKAQQWQHCKEHDTKYLNTQHFLPSLKSQLFLAYASNSNSKFLSVVFEMSKQLQVNLHFCLVAPWRLTEKQCFYVQGDNPLVFTTPSPFKTFDDLLWLGSEYPARRHVVYCRNTPILCKRAQTSCTPPLQDQAFTGLFNSVHTLKTINVSRGIKNAGYADDDGH